MLGAEKKSSVNILEWYIMAICATFAALLHDLKSSRVKIRRVLLQNYDALEILRHVSRSQYRRGGVQHTPISRQACEEKH